MSTASPSELAGPAGLARLGAETVPHVVTRGLLVDVAQLGRGDVIGVDADTYLSRPLSDPTPKETA